MRAGVLRPRSGHVSRHGGPLLDLAAALDYAGRYGGLGPVALVPGTRTFARPEL